MTLSPAYGGSSPRGGASNISLPLWGRWHAKRDGEGISRGANTPTNPNLNIKKTFFDKFENYVIHTY